MKKLFVTLIVVCLTSSILPEMIKGQNTIARSEQTSKLSILNGCWQRIAIIVNGKAESNPPQQIRLFHEGFYTIIGQDSANAWTHSFGGTYEISNNIYKEKTLYCSNPDIIGVSHWQEMNIKGDTVSFKLFKKMIDSSGKELTAPDYTRELVCVRVKK